ncbi:MAG: hypothetical protein IJH12_04765 [Clostridia bacterium]|nr:hypothetical protein [Clostridia bacterium]
MLKRNRFIKSNFFNIWFNRKKQKEFYTSSVVMYKTSLEHKNTNRFQNIIIDKDKIRSPIYFTKSDVYSPFEEKYGTFLIRFLNADFSTFESFYFTFICFYGFEILYEFNLDIPDTTSYENEDDFINAYTPIYRSVKTKLRHMQEKVKNCVDYMYNLNNNSKDSAFTPFEKYLTYVIRNNYFKYSRDIEVSYFQQFAYDNFNIQKCTITPKMVRNYIADDIINIDDSPIYSTEFLSNILYVCLFEISSNADVKIKICKNCGKYFIPNKQTEKYCDIKYYKDEIACKQTGANNSYNKKRASVEAIKYYRNNYQRRLMQVKKSGSAEIKTAFEKWKKDAKAKIKEFNNKEISEEKLLNWMIENKNL